MQLLTLPRLARLVEVEYRTLHSWVRRGLLTPSVQSSDGTGTPNLFTEEDAVAACIIADLRRAGVSFDLLERAAGALREHDDALTGEAFVLVNGTVDVVTGLETADSAIRAEGLTLLYNTEHATQRVRAALASA
jgi:DNA-binding transcriptional MerR regulator